MPTPGLGRATFTNMGRFTPVTTSAEHVDQNEHSLPEVHFAQRFVDLRAHVLGRGAGGIEADGAHVRQLADDVTQRADELVGQPVVRQNEYSDHGSILRALMTSR